MMILVHITIHYTPEKGAFCFMVYYILPIVFLVSGIILLVKPDCETNSLYGFRTKTSSVNEHTWKYCNILCAKILICIGVISIIAVSVVKSMHVKVFDLLSPPEIVHIIMAFAILASIPYVNHRCRKRFPEYY